MKPRDEYSEVYETWWLRLYICSYAVFSIVTNRDPDWDKVERLIKRGTRIRKIRHIKKLFLVK